MIKGNLSNVPAPYVYVDGESLFSRTGVFKVSPKAEYVSKLSRIMRELNVAVYIDPSGKVSESDLKKSPYLFTRVVKMPIPELVKLLRSERQAIFISDDRRVQFSAYGIAYSLDASAQEILSGVRVCSVASTKR